jgi:superfamily II DNA or RNA helicase
MRMNVNHSEGREELETIVRDPVRFARGLLRADLWDLQADILRSVANHRRTAVKASHGSGKSFVAAAAVLWWLARYRDGIVVTTAPTWTQIEKVLWGEILAAIQRSRIKFPQPNRTELRLGPGNYAIGLSTNEGVRFQGFHGGHILIVLDEACGGIWSALVSAR